MGFTGGILDEIRSDLAPTDLYLDEAGGRQKSVLTAGETFPGVNRSYRAGSLAHLTANKGADADCGIVLDRRSYEDLGPDGDDIGPQGIVEDFRDHIRPLVREDYPEARFLIKKRAIKITFNSPVDGEDPSVDLIVALERKSKPGLWIPNLNLDEWDASHPEKHTELFTSGSLGLRRVRAWVTRLSKGWNHQYSEGRRALSSFNLETLAWECIESDMTTAEGLEELFDYGARELAKADTDDPADVSEPIRLLLDRDTVVERLKKAAALMHTALENDDDENAVREALAELFWKHGDPPADSNSKAAWAKGLRSGNEGVRLTTGGVTLGNSGATIKTTRSSGDGSG